MYLLLIQLNLDSLNTDGSLTWLILTFFESLQRKVQENKYLRKFSQLNMKLYVVCTH